MQNPFILKGHPPLDLENFPRKFFSSGWMKKYPAQSSLFAPGEKYAGVGSGCISTKNPVFGKEIGDQIFETD